MSYMILNKGNVTCFFTKYEDAAYTARRQACEGGGRVTIYREVAVATARADITMLEEVPLLPKKVSNPPGLEEA